MNPTTRVGFVSVVVLLSGLVGCSASDSEAGFGLPTLGADQLQSVRAAAGSTPQERVGTLTVESNGCFTFEDSEHSTDPRVWIVWPDTAHQDGDVVVLESGRRLAQGDSLSASAEYLDLADLPAAGDKTSYLGSFGRFCGADTTGVVVFTDVHP